MDNYSAASNCSRSPNDVAGNSSPSRFAPPIKSDKLPTGKKLTKDLVLSKSKGGSLVEIKKIVIWGQKITDCSIVTEIPELEVASMNANKISSLEYFGQCPNLRELFLRSNCIEDIHEIYYLKELPNLHILWLAGNPCTKHPRYRSSVIRNLEQLQKLDDTEVVPAERASSESDGLLFEEPPALGADPLTPLDLAERMRPAEDADKDAAVKQEAAGPAESPQSLTQLPRYALAEVRTAVLRLIRLLDQESLELVMLTVRSRLDKEAARAAAAPRQQQQQPPAGPDIAPSFSMENL